MEFEGNPNIGIYMFANDKFCLVGNSLNENQKKEVEKVLQVPVYPISILSTDLIGIFIAGNNEMMLIPEVFDHEREELTKICKKHEVELIEFSARLNTLGNNICVGDKKLLINPEYSDGFKKNVKLKTKYEIFEIENPEFRAIGSVCKFLNGKYFVSQEFEENQLKMIVDEVGAVGSVNGGSNYVASGIIGNSNGLILGSMSSTVEIQSVVEGLNYL